MKFRKRPVVVEARLFDGSNFDELYEWGTKNGSVLGAKILLAGGGEDEAQLVVETLEGDMRCSVGDWIVKGVQGEFYPVKPDIFAETYEPMEEP